MNEDIISLLTEHAEQFPGMEPTDAVKLLYQNAFGCGHFVSSEEASLAALKREWHDNYDDVNATTFVEDIGNGYCRLHLCRELFDKFSVDTVNRLFVMSSRLPQREVSQFINNLAVLQSLVKSGVFSFGYEELVQYLKVYEAAGYKPVSHSETYRNLYNPHYRVVSKDILNYSGLFDKVFELNESVGAVIAIDGMCGSGKSGLAALIGNIFDCNIIHMDDFFLPFSQRTPERMSETGGNIDYERFVNDVINHLNDNSFCYKKYDCSSGKFFDETLVNKKPLTVVEGSYSMHPYFGKYYDLAVFLTLDTDLQKSRILARSGEGMLKRFISEWIPMENTYFCKTDTASKAGYVYDTSKFF